MSERTVKPYDENEDKKSQVGRMFDNIAKRYDLLNRVLSAGVDQRWRKNVSGRLKDLSPSTILDIATGTADLALMCYDQLQPEKVIGVDISQKMLDVGQSKITKRGLEDRINLEWGDSENLTFKDNSFDAVTVAFGVRNFGDLEKGLEEIYRVIRPGGKAVILEFSQPRLLGFKQLYNFYFSTILPSIGKWTSKDPKAYKYLYESVQSFPDYEAFLQILEKKGFKKTGFFPQTFGICCIYEGVK